MKHTCAQFAQRHGGGYAPAVPARQAPAPPVQRTRKRSDFVKSLDRGLAVICAFGPDHPQLTVSDVAELTGITRAASRRFLLTLTDLGYLSTDGRSFTMMPRVLELGYSYLSSLTLPELARPYMVELARQLNEDVSLAILDGVETVNVGRVETTGYLRVSIPVGTRFPAHLNSMGRVLLASLLPAQLDEYFEKAVFEARTPRTVTDPAKLRRLLATVRDQGYAVVNQELENGLIALAVPLHNTASSVAAAMSVSTHSFRIDPQAVKRQFLPPLQAAARRIDEALRAALPLH
jgi:IclR family transcriptional regulator, pca regulon regulatory protein